MILKSWKEIAKYLRCGVRTAQRWEQEMGLPIRRPGSPNRNVLFAFSEELDTWIGSGGKSVAQDVRGSISRQSELKQELRELRGRQRDLIAQLRISLKKSKGSAASVSNSKAPSMPARMSPSRLPLLTVDDNASQCYAISQVLRHAGFQVFEAHSATEAFETAQREIPALILLDIHLQDLNGYELFGLLRANPKTEKIGVVFYTAFAPSEPASFVAEKLGAEGFLQSPIDPNLLVDFVQSTIAKLNQGDAPDLRPC